jgi:hypothetical protein
MLTLTLEVPNGVEADVVVPGEAQPRVLGAGSHVVRYPVRPAKLDPVPTRVLNLHNPEETREAALAI